LFLAASAALGAQQASQSNPYEGTSNPPKDDQIVTTTNPLPKPPAGHPLIAPAAAPAPVLDAQPTPAATVDVTIQAQPSAAAPAPSDPDAGPVSAPPPAQPVQAAPAPVLAARASEPDPDGDIVHPAPLGPGQLGDGTHITVKLLDRLSTWDSQKGEPFRSQVAEDVLQGGQVVIPAGTEIDGTVVQASSGHFGGHGSMRLRPEAVIMPNGNRYMLRAVVTGIPGSRTRLGDEGTILPPSRVKRDVIEYSGVVGAGAATGAVLAGPVGAVAGGAIGAGAVTTHLLVDHPQATLEEGAIIQFTLTDTLSLTPAGAPGS
jgi:hypothetical protein